MVSLSYGALVTDSINDGATCEPWGHHALSVLPDLHSAGYIGSSARPFSQPYVHHRNRCCIRTRIDALRFLWRQHPRLSSQR